MILINLLPEEYIEKKLTIPIPLKEIGLGILAFLGVLLIFVIVHTQGLQRDASTLDTELKAMAPDLAQSEQLIREMNQELIPKKNFIDQFQKPEAHWDQILNFISDSLPDGVWLTSLMLSDSPLLNIQIEGLAKPYKSRSPIGLVGDFITEAKKRLEEFAGDTKGSVFDIQTFTQQKDMEPVKLTQFVVRFQKKAGR